MTTPARYFAVYIGTTNDTNGNPRRGWLVHEPGNDGAGVRWVEEGYSGRDALNVIARVAFNDPDATTDECRGFVRREVYETGRINVTPGEYRDARKLPRFVK